MKTVAAIKNELFQGYLKVVSTDDLEQTLDNPNVPVPFVCVAAVQNPNSDKIAAEINKFFEHKKLKNKDFLAMTSDDISQLSFLFNLVQVSTTGQSAVVAAPAVKEEVAVAPTPVVEKAVEVVAEVAPVVEKQVKVVVEPVVEPVVEAVVESEPVAEVAPEPVVEVAEVVAEPVVEVEAVVEEAPAASTDGVEMIESLNIPKHSTIQLAKNAEITATIVDEKTVVFDGEELPIVDATKRAFKKAGTTGMALGLANWNFEGTSLKALKEKN